MWSLAWIEGRGGRGGGEGGRVKQVREEVRSDTMTIDRYGKK